eukprot:jgi/Ulvmu1/7580/UM038_0003.1
MTRPKTPISCLFDGESAEDAGAHAAKRRKRSAETSSSIEELLGHGGCVWSRDSCSVHDLQTLRSTLASSLAFHAERITIFTEGVSNICGDPNFLRASCLPLVSTEGVLISDTLMQVLLTTQCLEEPLTKVLLEKLVEVCNEEGTTSTAQPDEEADPEQQHLPQLLLAQLQVLDNGNCSEKVAHLMIEAFESLPPHMQAQICAIVGEVVPLDQIKDVLEALQAAVTQHTELAVPVSAALKRLPLSLAQRMDAVDTMLRHLSSVPAEHVADVTIFIMQHCNPGPHAIKVCKTLREVLRFGSAEDMRMPVESESVIAPVSSPEAVLISKVRFQSKALGHISAAFERLWERLSDPSEWRVLDFWWLLIAHHANFGAHSNILKSFRSAFRRTPMEVKLLQQALRGHELTLKVFHGTIISIATAALSSHAGGLGRHLLQALLTLPQVQAPDTFDHSSVLALRALQSTLASITCTDTSSTDAAITVLLECSAHSCAFFLRRQESFVRVMPRLEHLQDPQIHSLAKLFGRMIVQEGAPADEMVNAPSHPFTSAAQQHYDNMLAAADMSKNSIAVIGVLHWVFGMAAVSHEKAEIARSKLEMLVQRLQKIPILMAFLLDTFSDMLVLQFRDGNMNTSVRCPLTWWENAVNCIHGYSGDLQMWQYSYA